MTETIFKCCVFTVCDDAYVPNAVVSLKSVHRWNSDVDLLVVGKHFSAGTKELIRGHGLSYIEVNYTEKFPRSWDYPEECFYWFGGPAILSELGYTHSIYMDGDIYCNADPIPPLREVKLLAGVRRGGLRKMAQSDLAIIEKAWSPVADIRRLQSGVLYMNHGPLLDFGLLDRASELFKWSIENEIPRKGDDSLLALLQAVHPELETETLPDEFNVILDSHINRRSPEWLTHRDDLITSATFFHFTGATRKPWSAADDFPCYTAKYFAQKWILLAIDTLNDAEFRNYFPKFASQLGDDHLRFYWWGERNVGDLVTPYLLGRAQAAGGQKMRRISERDSRMQDALFQLIKMILFWRGSTAIPARYIVSTGSVHRLCGPGSLVFGSGIRTEEQETLRAKVRFVRGPRTRQRYLSAGVECPPIYGDPGLLMPHFYRPEIRQRYALGILPHFTEYPEVASAYADDDDVLVVDMGCGDLEAVIDAILSCRVTVSSSLHGLIFSHAYGVPTRHVIYSNKVFGDGTKYHDHYEAVGLHLNSLDLRDAGNADRQALVASADEVLENFNDVRLLDAFFVGLSGLKRSTRYPF